MASRTPYSHPLSALSSLCNTFTWISVAYCANATERSSEDVTMLEVCRVSSGRARYAREKVRGNKQKIRVAHQESLPLRDCPPRTLLKQAAQTSANKRVISGSDPAPLPSVMYFSLPRFRQAPLRTSEAQVVLRIDLGRTLRASVRALHADSAGRRRGRPAFGFGLGLAVLFGVGIGVRDGVEGRRKVPVLGFVVRVEMCTAGGSLCLSVPID